MARGDTEDSHGGKSGSAWSAEAREIARMANVREGRKDGAVDGVSFIGNE